MLWTSNLGNYKLLTHILKLTFHFIIIERTAKGEKAKNSTLKLDKRSL